MSTAFKVRKFASVHFLCVIALCLCGMSTAASASVHTRKAKKPPAPLPSGPTGPVPQVPLDSIKPVAPQVSFQNGQLTIVAPNSSLGDILRAVRTQTGAEIDIPADAHERVVTRLGPGPARDVIADLLNGSRFNYVLVGSPQDVSALTRVVLVAKSGPENAAPNTPGQPGVAQANNMAPPPEQEGQPDAQPDAEATDDNAAAEENTDQSAAEAEQEQPPPADQPGAKTPQQMLQEMQQRQMQLQQMQPPGQPPVPGAGMPPRPPQEP